MEFIVQLFRALANRQRIRMLRLLVVFREMNVSQIAEAARVAMPVTSGHLKVLAAAGLVWRRRSGRVVPYRLAEHAGNPVTAAALRVLDGAFRNVAPNAPRTVAKADLRDSPTNSDAALFACFTAFTHPRRLQVIRHLLRHNSASVPDLVVALSMSRDACARHLAKLTRRGAIAEKQDKRGVVYRLASVKGAAQKTLLGAVCEYLAGE